MTWWIPFVAPTATFIASKLPPLPGFEPVEEIADEEYILVDHDPYEGTKAEAVPKPQPKSTDEVLEEERQRDQQQKEKHRLDSGIVVEEKSRRDRAGAAKDEEAVRVLMNSIDKEIVDSRDDPFNWRWFTTADLRNRDIYIYNKRRLLLERKLKTAAEAKHFLPLGRNTSKLDDELRVLDMVRQGLDRRFAAKYDYIPPVETWARCEESDEQRKRVARIAVLKGVLSAAYGIQVPF